MLSIHLPQLGKELLEKIERYGQVETIPAHTQIVRQGQYLKVLPIVIKGSIKVSIKNEEKEFLLYHIQPNESCIMSFSSILFDQPSRIYATTEEESIVLLLPIEQVKQWNLLYPQLNSLFLRLFDSRYQDLVETIFRILFQDLPTRLLTYLTEKQGYSKNSAFKVTHKDIAADLGSSREVISRILKKLEAEGKITQSKEGIFVL
jgi:CRP/FNR family transcriptional regulator, anaerobic regulatory protein